MKIANTCFLPTAIEGILLSFFTDDYSPCPLTFCAGVYGSPSTRTERFAFSETDGGRRLHQSPSGNSEVSPISHLLARHRKKKKDIISTCWTGRLEIKITNTVMRSAHTFTHRNCLVFKVALSQKWQKAGEGCDGYGLQWQRRLLIGFWWLPATCPVSHCK